MARWKLLVVVAPHRQAHLDLRFRNFDFGPHNDVRFLPWGQEQPAPFANLRDQLTRSEIPLVQHDLLCMSAGDQA
jgi:hypothetical protein